MYLASLMYGILVEFPSQIMQSTLSLSGLDCFRRELKAGDGIDHWVKTMIKLRHPVQKQETQRSVRKNTRQCLDSSCRPFEAARVDKPRAFIRAFPVRATVAFHLVYYELRVDKVSKSTVESSFFDNR